MAPSTILIVGATGNTGQSAVRTLSALLLSANKDTRILGLTRSLTSDVSKQLDLLPNVEMMEKNWTTIGAAWLQEQGVMRAYVASHNLSGQFTDESRLYVAMLQAGVQYVVRISTMTQYVSSTNIVDYGRQHWAVESLLSQPEFAGLQWTSLQPHVFLNFCLNFADDWLKTYRTTGEQEPLEVMISADQLVAAIDPEDVGDVGAHLLALEDPSTHNRAKYVMTGPEDITGKQVVAMFEDAIGVKVNTVNYESTKKVDYSMEIGIFPKVAKASFAASLGFICRGECSLAGPRTSEAAMDLAPPTRMAKQALDAILSA